MRGMLWGSVVPRDSVQFQGLEFVVLRLVVICVEFIALCTNIQLFICIRRLNTTFFNDIIGDRFRS